ncbi:DUF397 domain-containing protein [Streptomyces sp. NBC_00989]|nr:DUF397 domain-containing protein [Streptomyces sp. NBC_00989]
MRRVPGFQETRRITGPFVWRTALPTSSNVWRRSCRRDPVAESTFSSGSDGANCVEVASSEGELLLRESDDPTRTLPSPPPPSPPSSTAYASSALSDRRPPRQTATSEFMGTHSPHPCFLQTSYLPSGHDGKRNNQRVAGTTA